MDNIRQGWTAAFFIGFLWGMPCILATPLLEYMDSLTIVWLQYTIACLTLGLLLKVFHKKKSPIIIKHSNFHGLIEAIFFG